jgi:D-hydroxyproline dehydrogenase subunit beta
MSETYDAIVVGAGIVGSACAYDCAIEGMRVALVEGGEVGGGATGAGMGHIVVMDDSAAQFELTRYSRDLWKRMAAQLPSEAEYRECGTIWVAAGEEEMVAVERKHEFYHERGVETKVLNAAELYSLEPHLRPGLSGGFLVPGDAVVYAPAVCRFLMQSAAQQGVTIHQEKVLTAHAGKVLLSSRRELSSARVVNATGEWADTLTPGIPVRRRKGHLAITDRYPGFIRHQLVELAYLKSAHSSTSDSVAFNLQPRATGQILIGSSRQFDVTSKDVETGILSTMLRRAIEYVPELATMSVLRTWTGFRAATPDKLPLIGPWQEDNTIYLATGHEGLGITTSMGTAQLLADQFAGRSPEISFEPYLPKRPSLQVLHV